MLYEVITEWNLLDEELRPLLTVGAGPSQKSFVDYLRTDCVPLWQAQFSQLEVFHWMIEWAYGCLLGAGDPTWHAYFALGSGSMGGGSRNNFV